MPFFHYSDQASCIVTTTNFLAVYKVVNQNHTEQGVEEGGGTAGWAAGLRTRCHERGRGKDGRRRRSSYHLKTSVLQAFFEVRTRFVGGCAE